MRTRAPRPAFTLMELLLVLAVLIILAAVVFPSFSGLRGNADQKAAVDQVRGRIADARGLAMQEGVPYRLAVHQDGSKLRLAPDVPEFGQLPTSSVVTSSAKAVETKLEKATVKVVADTDSGDQRTADGSGWITVGTFLADGTCREDDAMIEVRETGSDIPIRIRLRGVTGSARVLRPDEGTGGMK